MIYFLTIGLFFTGIGLVMRLGYMKRLYLAQGASFLIPKVVKYIFLPFGASWMMVSLLVFVPLEYRAILFRSIFGPMLVLTLILAVWQPNWLLPYWLSYLRKTYGYGMTERLLMEAGRDPLWFKKVKTHEGLVAWAEETAAKSGLNPPIHSPEKDQ